MQLTDLKPDDYYYAEYSDHTEFAIVKGTEGKRSNLYVNSDENKNSFWKFNNCSAFKNLRLATPQEIHWLECCIEKRIFISFEEALKSFVDSSINYQQDSEYNNILIKLLTT
jgi:hypothetical protein